MSKHEDMTMGAEGKATGTTQQDIPADQTGEPDPLGDEMGYEELLQRAQSGELGLPVTVDPSTGEVVISIDTDDEEALAKLEQLLSQTGIGIPDDLVGYGHPVDIMDEPYGEPFSVPLDEYDDDVPEFDLSCLMVSNMGDKDMLEYASNLVSGGLYELASGEPEGIRSLGDIRDGWEVDWIDETETGMALDHVRYLLGKYPPETLRALAEAAFRRALLILVSESGDILNGLMEEMAAQMVACLGDQDEDNPITRAEQRQG